jgi:hypothetical protein
MVRFISAMSSPDLGELAAALRELDHASRVERHVMHRGSWTAEYPLEWATHIANVQSNHPPAEPGALSLVPLEAASGSLRGPDR